MVHHTTAPATPVFEHMAELTYHLEGADDAWADWKRGDVTANAVTAEFYALARAAFAAARQLRADDAVITAEGDLFTEPEFQHAHGAQVADPFDVLRAEIAALPSADTEGDA